VSDTTRLSRRAALAAAATGATAGVSAIASPSVPAVRYRSVAYAKTPVPSTATRHLLSRFSYGVTPGLVRDAKRAGGALNWFEQQLNPQAIDDPFANGLDSWWPSLSRSPQQAWKMHIAETYPGHRAMFDMSRWALLRRAYSRRQVQEVMSEFWLNFLHVPALSGPHFTWRIDYEKTIRARALGSFTDLLTASITHPAMLIYLDGATSTAKEPNENLGRELLELHTVGRDGGYTEAHVKDSARILTGWHVDVRDTWQPSYVHADHATGPVTVMGFTEANASSDGRALTHRYLSYLANHPATAQQIAHRLAVSFVSDNPPADLVDHLAKVYLDNDTQIKAVLRALVRHPAFNAAVGAKIRTPSQDVIATYRVLGIQVSRPRADDSAANRILWDTQRVGQRVYAWPRPDGEPLVNDAWTGTSRILGSFFLHKILSSGRYPNQDIRYRRPVAWLPQRKMRFDQFVDHLSRQVLGRPSTDLLLKAACQMTGIRPRERITKRHSLFGYKMPHLLPVLLDTPAHMTR